MPSFESPLGTKRFGGVGSGMKEFDVPDESGTNYGNIDSHSLNEFQNRLEREELGNSDYISELNETEREFKAARDARKHGKERLNDGAKRRIEMLIGTVSFTRSVILSDNEYVFQALRSKDNEAMYMAAAKFDGTVQFPFEVRRQSIARSLIKVAGVNLDQFIGSSALESKLAFVDELPEYFLQKLFTEYQLMVKESTEKFSIKNDEDIKEVVEDLKK